VQSTDWGNRVRLIGNHGVLDEASVSLSHKMLVCGSYFHSGCVSAGRGAAVPQCPTPTVTTRTRSAWAERLPPTLLSAPV
jgi:hypothetical protein